MKVGTLIIGLLLVLLGEIFFLINLGYGSWGEVYKIIRFWPIVIILIGMAVFWKGKLPLVVAYLVIILTVTAAGLYMITFQPAIDETTTVKTLYISHEQYPDIKQGKLKINFGGGKLAVKPGTQDILQADLTRPIKQHTAANNQSLNINISQNEFNWDPVNDNPNNWQLKISPELTWDLGIDAGAVDGEIDLSGIPLRRLSCNIGAGNMLFILGNNGADTKLSIDSGASNIKLQIANDTGARIKLNGALKSSNLDNLGWSKDGSYYISPNYQQAASKIDCDVNLSMGYLEIQMP